MRSLPCLFALCLLSIGNVAARTIGDFDGDGKTDITVIRWRIAPQLGWFVLRTSDAKDSVFPWGKTYDSVSGWEDREQLGDFDGDGKSDFVIWRNNLTTNEQAYFWILRSSDSVVQVVTWGELAALPLYLWKRVLFR